MLQQKIYTKIYTAYDDYGYVQLFLYNHINADALSFDGLNFVYKSAVTNIPSGFKELTYASTPTDVIYEIESIKQLDDITFIKFTNGNVFQLHTMPYGNNGFKQVLSIFKKGIDSHISTPLGINSYDAGLMRFNKGEECEIEVES